jgi:hypothetical protein
LHVSREVEWATAGRIDAVFEVTALFGDRRDFWLRRMLVRCVCAGPSNSALLLERRLAYLGEDLLLLIFMQFGNRLFQVVTGFVGSHGCGWFVSSELRWSPVVVVVRVG